MWLSDLTRGRYEVREKKCAKKGTNYEFVKTAHANVVGISHFILFLAFVAKDKDDADGQPEIFRANVFEGNHRPIYVTKTNEVKKIVLGQFGLFQTMYKPYLEEHANNDLLRFSSSCGHQVNISQVHILKDKLDISNVNSVNLRAATSAALLLLPSKFNEFGLFKKMYRPCLEEHATNDLLRFSSSGDHQVNISQDSSLSAVSCLVSILPATIRSQMMMRLGEEKKVGKSGQVIRELVINSREEVAECMRKVVRPRVMISSARQAVCGILTVGAVHGVRYLANKMHKAWKSWT